MAKTKGFKDISLSFEPHPVTKDIPILANERAIVGSQSSCDEACGVAHTAADMAGNAAEPCKRTPYAREAAPG